MHEENGSDGGVISRRGGLSTAVGTAHRLRTLQTRGVFQIVIYYGTLFTY